MYKLSKDFIEINGVLYQILRVIAVDHLPIIDTWKEHLRADKVFKRDDAFFFVREVPEAEIVTEEPLYLPPEKQETDEKI